MRTKEIIGLSSLLIGTVTGYVLHRLSVRNLKNAVEIYNLNLE